MPIKYKAVRLTWVSLVFQTNCAELTNKHALILDTQFGREIYWNNSHIFLNSTNNKKRRNIFLMTLFSWLFGTPKCKSIWCSLKCLQIEITLIAYLFCQVFIVDLSLMWICRQVSIYNHTCNSNILSSFCQGFESCFTWMDRFWIGCCKALGLWQNQTLPHICVSMVRCKMRCVGSQSPGSTK